jgi:O-antigen/teichoic acid export membrane protein
LLSVPLTIGYLGQERYGVWVLVGSLLAWFRLADIGIGNGLTNSIANALGTERPDLVRIHISTAFALLSAIALVLGLPVAFAWPWIDWAGLFGVQSELARAQVGPAMAAAVTFFLLGFPLSVISRTYIASQQGKLANYWAAAGNIASFLALVGVAHTRGSLLWLVIAVSGTGLLVNAMSGIWLFVFHNPALAPSHRHIRKSSAKGMFGIGVQFFLIQIMALIVFETDNLIIAHYLGAAQVPSYSLTYSLFNYSSIVQVILFNYVWVAYTEAIARRDIDWVRRTFTLNVTFSLGFTSVAALVLIVIARPFIKLWAGENVVPPIELVYWMAAWSVIYAFCSPIACLLAAAAHLRAQTIYAFVATVINVPLSIFLVQRWGITGSIAATVIAYLVAICLPTSIDVALLLRKLRNAV